MNGSPAAPNGPGVARDARLIARAAASGALATSRRAKRASGQPYVSKVGVALDLDGGALFLFSTLAAHTQDLLVDPRASLLVEAPQNSENPLESPRATLVGRAHRLTAADDVLRARAVYLSHHPGAARYVDFGDFAFWKLDVERVHFVGGFGRAKWARGAAYLCAPGDLAAKRADVLERLNADKQDALAALAGLGLGRGRGQGRGRGWRALDLDPDGLTLAGPRGKRLRVDFPSPARDRRGWAARFAACVRRAQAERKDKGK